MITNWVAQAAIDGGKPLPGKEGLNSAERQELTLLLRELCQVQMERDIFAKATAWFAAKGERTSTTSSNSEREPCRRFDRDDVPRVEGLAERLLCVARSRPIAPVD